MMRGIIGKWSWLLILALAVPAVAGDSSKDSGVLSLVPTGSLAVLEHVGHTAIKPAFEKSNFGKMMADEAIAQFVNDSRVQFGKMIILKNLYDFSGDSAQINQYHAQLHEMLKPFWYDPAALFFLPPLNEKGQPKMGSPQLGFVCIVEPSRLETAKKAMDFFRDAQAAKPGEKGTRQSVVWTHKVVRWQGVLKRNEPFAKPEAITEKELRNGDVFLYTWRSRILYVALSVDAAMQISQAMTAEEQDARSKAAGVVLDRTKMSDWAFRWYVDVEKIKTLAMQEVDKDEKAEAQKTLKDLGVDRLLSVGGTMGYIDNTLARKTFLYTPGVTQGVFKLLAPGGDYKKAFVMTPPGQTFVAAGQLDIPQFGIMVKKMISSRMDDSRKQDERVLNVSIEMYKAKYKKNPPSLKALAKDGFLNKDSAGEFEKKFKYDPQTGKLTTIAAKDNIAERKQMLEKLLLGFDGRAAAYVGDMQGLMMGAPSMGVVLGVKDQEKTRQALQDLFKVMDAAKPVVAMLDKTPNLPSASQPTTDKGGSPNDAPSVTMYRKVMIRRIQAMNLAIMKDRVILATNDLAVKGAIDAAKDGAGGMKKGARGEALLAQCGKGQAVVVMDLAMLAKLFWPMLMNGAESSPESFPFASMPSAAKIIGMLDPEVAVFKNQPDGLLIESRGKIPFASKVFMLYPMQMFAFMFMMGF